MNTDFWCKALWYWSQFGRAPNPWARNRVLARLSARPDLSKLEWFERHWQPRGISPTVVDHVYERFHSYSGLPMGRVLPADRLLGDLEFGDVCWSDWDADHFEDFKRAFGIEIATNYPEVDSETTFEQILKYLDLAVRHVRH